MRRRSPLLPDHVKKLQVSYSLTVALQEQIAEAARLLGKSKSAVVQELLEPQMRYFMRKIKVAQKSSIKRALDSFLAVAASSLFLTIV
jgi:hypothetical protein